MSYQENNNIYASEPPARHSMNVSAPQVPAQPMTPRLPTGFPTGPSPTPLQRPTMPTMPGEQSPMTLQSTMYTPGFLKTQIGKTMRVEFLMGSGPLVDRIGKLLDVGASYILLQPVGTDDRLLCDIYSIKFVTILSHAISNF